METGLEFVQTISLEEMALINGGSVNDDAYNAGYATGKYVGKIIAGVGILAFFWFL